MTDATTSAPGDAGSAQRLHGKVAIVTGAASGMGASHVRALAAEGAHVIAGDINTDVAPADETLQNVQFVKLDVTDESDWANARELAFSTWGAVDVLVNNAGVSVGGGVELADYEMDNFRRTMEVNFFGAVNGMRAVLPAMKAAGRGSIINIGSISGLNGWYRNSAYTSSKAAVGHITKSVALEYGEYGVRINAVHPGLIDTPMAKNREFLTGHIAMKRMGTVDEVSRVVVFLASDEASFVTGSGFVVDGGESSGRPAPNYKI